MGVAAVGPVEPASAAVPLSLDSLVTTHGGSATSVTSPAFTTTQGGELLVAFLTADGPSVAGTQTFSSVAGGGVIWRLRQRSNARAGTSEIWTAVAPTALTGATVQATHAGSWVGSITVASFVGADLTTDGAVGTANAATGAPGGSVTTTRAGSWVWGVGNDWDRATARTVATGQTKVDEYLTSVGDTFWVQRQTATTANAGTVVPISDTAPTNDRWNLALIEITSASPDSTPPTVPANLVAQAVGPNQVNLAWSASTDNTAVQGYRVLRGGTSITTTTSTSFTDTAVSPATSYTYTVQAYDAAGNSSAGSTGATVTTPALDTVPPTISGVTATSITQTSATVTWATDEASSSQVDYGPSAGYGTSTTLDTNRVTAHSQAIGGLSAATTYHYRVRSTDAAGNLALSTDRTLTTLSPVADTTSPTASVTSPTNASSVAGTIALAATANDDVGVAGVQFTVDGTPLGTEDTTAPYGVSWDTTAAADGVHTVTAVARDAAGNTGTSAVVTVTVANATNTPAVIGQWAPSIPWPEVSIHAALTPTGKILTFQGDFTQAGQQYVFDPVSGSINQVPNAAADLFCAGQAVTADGRILVIGGTATSGGLGIRNVTAFDSSTETWQNLAPMQLARWYATGTTMGDGRVLVTSGYDKADGDLVVTPEVYDVPGNSWSTLPAATQSQPVYPFQYQLPDGRILWGGASETPSVTKVLNVATQTWTTIDSRVIDGSSIVNYAPNKFMKAGSAADSGNSGPSSRTAFTLDMSQPNPTWQPTSSMAFARSFVNLTALPDGTVLATGGDTEKSGHDDANGVLQAERWNPATGTWTTLAAMSEARLYHSVAVLLPDGRVFVSGGGGDAGVPDHKSAQIYSPSYLFKGPRPTITSAPGTVQYGQATFVATPDAAGITSVSLIRTGSVTHSFDQNSRALSLPFTQAAGGLNVQMPVDGNTAPPGYYMLSIVNGAGVPSVSAMIRFPAPYEDTFAPSAPTNLSGTGAVGKATLSWTASTDNVGVTGYDVYRSTTSGFTPSPGTKVGATTTPSYTGTGVVAGTYFYKVRANDGVGNAGAPSNEATITVLADTTAPSAPTNLLSTAMSSTQVTLGWTASSDDVGVTRYNVLRNGAPVGTSPGTGYVDTTVQPTTAYSYTVTAQDAAGNVSAPSSTSTVTTPSQTTAIGIDKTVSLHQSSAATSIAVGGLTTTGSNELIVAFVSSDGPSPGAVSFSAVTGGGLTWRLRQRANTQAGTSEVWVAAAGGPLSNATITATRSGGSQVGSITVVGFTNASVADGAVAGAGASTGSPTASLTSTVPGSWVWGVGNDWDRSVARVVGPGQTKVDEYLASVGDTFWVQSRSVPGGPAGSSVTLNDTSPTTDRWNVAALEILPR
ncbi:galactose oxidase-like domain-containing protein [Cellulomonas sp. McL0617]|uniref:galactose oxidase-like domain-containing protein n=1 Tax=Cellulomonas sp. McL0617 TaxID=3415675 RepID=UPI003CF3B856